MTVIDERARRGARLMDLLDPKWAKKIDIDTLDLSSNESCVLGQWKGWHDGSRKVMRRVSGDEWPADRHAILVEQGVEAPESFWKQHDHARLATYFAGLTAAWRAEIKARLEAADA